MSNEKIEGKEIENFDFKKYFDETVKHDIEWIRETNTAMKTQFLHMYKNKRLVVSPIIIVGREVSPMYYVAEILKGVQPEYYIFVSGSWMKMQHKDDKWRPTREKGKMIEDLPAEQRHEMVFWIGKGLKGDKVVLEKFYEIKREKHGDDDSKIVSIEQFGENDLTNIKLGWGMP